MRFDINSLYKSCRILFGEDVVLTPQFLSYIQPSGVKSAFRQKALQTHPDRLIQLPDAERDEKREIFHQIASSYKELLNFLKARDSNDVKVITEGWSDTNNITRDCNYNLYRYYKGNLPKRELLFGEFLYYSGNVPWKAYIDAIVWQRRQRPRFGEIAKDWKFLEKEQIEFLIKNKVIGELIGETAVRFALMTRLQVKTIVLHQRMKQKKIGEYFINEGFLSKDEINDLYLQFRRHNILYKAKKIY
ncbi:MAG: J domain-containing protein [Thermodesulfovibrionales bacterium]|nr:J domain-containing protein [Thermodesulfovibrionales bacterium]